MSRVCPADITAWSWVSSMGKFHSEGPYPSLSECLQAARLGSHDSEYGIPGYSGRYPLELPDLPERYVHLQSRCARLLYEALLPLKDRVQKLRAKWGSTRIAVVLGSSTGGVDATEIALRHERRTGKLPADYRFCDVHPYDALLELVRGELELAGPAVVVSTACSSGGKALASAQRMLHAGLADAAVVGGADALCELTVRGFAGLGVLSEESCRPFDRDRSGISIGEGAALLLLEIDSSAPIQLLGAGESSDAFHATAPHPEGMGAELALRACLEHSGILAQEVGYLNAHGTGTDKNDSMESSAIARVFGPELCFSSTKSRTGHQLGTAGATEAIVCLQAVSEGKAPRGLDPATWDESLAARPRCVSQSVDIALSNSFAFGGSNVTIALGRKRADPPKRPELPPTCSISGLALWSPLHPGVQEFSLDKANPQPLEPPAHLLPARARGRASMLTRMFAELYAQLLHDDESHNDSLPTIYSSCFGEMATTLQLLDQLETDLRLSPIRFQSSVHNTASGRISLERQNRAFSTALAAGQASFAMALLEAQAWLAAHGGEVLVLVADEAVPARLEPNLKYLPLGIGLRLNSTTASGLRAQLIRHEGQHPEAQIDEQAIGKARFAPFQGAPPAWGLPLIDALSTKKRGAFPVGPGWWLELQGGE